MSLDIFEPWVTERGESALPADSNSFDQLRQLEDGGEPAGRGSKPFEVRLIRKDDGRSFKESDCPEISGGFMVLRPAAVEVFRLFLGDDAELLDLLCADAELKLLNVWRHLLATDTADGVFLSRLTFHLIVHVTQSDGVVRVAFERGHFHFFDGC